MQGRCYESYKNGPKKSSQMSTYGPKSSCHIWILSMPYLHLDYSGTPPALGICYESTLKPQLRTILQVCKLKFSREIKPDMDMCVLYVCVQRERLLPIVRTKCMHLYVYVYTYLQRETDRQGLVRNWIAWYRIGEIPQSAICKLETRESGWVTI